MRGRVALKLAALAGLWCMLPPSAEGRGPPYWVEAGRRMHAQRSEMSWVAKRARQAVVAITTVQGTPWNGAGALGPHDEADAAADAELGQKGLGAGFLIHPDGYILTAAHVVEGALEISAQVLSPGGDPEEYSAKLVGQDPHTDLALLKIDAPRRLPVLKLGSSRNVDIADWVVVIGNPFGLAHSVSVGVVSYKGRDDVMPSGRRGFFDYLQTDAAINPGSSGGPVLDIAGEVVAIANAVNVSGQGIGFAVPIDLAKAVLPQLYTTGGVRRGWLGISVEDLTPALAGETKQTPYRGVFVSEVSPEGPADRAGLAVGDVIVGIDRRPLERAQQLRWTLTTAGVGRRLLLTVKRHGERREVRVRLDEAPAAHPDGRDVPRKAAEPHLRQAMQ